MLGCKARHLVRGRIAVFGWPGLPSACAIGKEAGKQRIEDRVTLQLLALFGAPCRDPGPYRVSAILICAAQLGHASRDRCCPVDQLALLCRRDGFAHQRGIAEQDVEEQPAGRRIGAEARSIGWKQRVNGADRQRIGARLRQALRYGDETAEIAECPLPLVTQRRDLHRSPPRSCPRRKFGGAKALRRRDGQRPFTPVRHQPVIADLARRDQPRAARRPFALHLERLPAFEDDFGPIRIPVIRQRDRLPRIARNETAIGGIAFASRKAFRYLALTLGRITQRGEHLSQAAVRHAPLLAAGIFPIDLQPGLCSQKVQCLAHARNAAKLDGSPGWPREKNGSP